MIVLGIDPGQTGGLALVSEGRLLNACPIPCTYDHTNKPTLAWATATIWLNGWDVDHAVIENVHAMPAQGVLLHFNSEGCSGRLKCSMPAGLLLSGMWSRKYGNVTSALTLTNIQQSRRQLSYTATSTGHLKSTKA